MKALEIKKMKALKIKEIGLKYAGIITPGLVLKLLPITPRMTSIHLEIYELAKNNQLLYLIKESL